MADLPSTEMSYSHLGASGELLASAWLLGLGYEVFRNLSPAGPADLAIWHPTLREFHLIDVKTNRASARYTTGGRIVLSGRARRDDPDVRILVIQDGVVAGFFRQKPGCIPARYWPLGVKQPPLPDGYNDNEDEPQPNVRRQIESNGRKMSLAQAAREAGMSRQALQSRIRRGATLTEAMSKPIRRYRD